jgi:UDP-N-acetylglucosamine--N-acetylmuramyl-(pentapeptide) pyrophosphoryl-undecaprenol N-acetylglucosamine transferase
VTTSALRVALVGGGSGGHLFPAVAIVQALQRTAPDSRFLFLTCQRPVDRLVLASAGWPDASVQVQPYTTTLGSASWTARLRQIPAALTALRSARESLRDFRPDVVVGLGAFASVPGVVAASRLKIPIVLLEQNVIPGRATRALAPRAQVVLTGLPVDSRYTIRTGRIGKVIETGVPLRDSFQARSPFSSTGAEPRLLVLGGSQGARRLNQLVLDALSDDAELLGDWRIIHQTGDADSKTVVREYARLGRSAEVHAFLHDLPEQLAAADLVVSRSGAGLLHELACVGRPAILIPMNRSAGGHQMANARLFERSQAAVVINEMDPDAVGLFRAHLRELGSQPANRRKLSSTIRTFARPDAAQRAAEWVRHCAQPAVG